VYKVHINRYKLNDTKIALGTPKYIYIGIYYYSGVKFILAYVE